MQSFVLGFAFSQNLQHVVLIKKDGNSVPAHKGLLNGVGGKIEELETAVDAMTREFEEETGVEIPAAGWVRKGEFYGPAFCVEVFVTVTDKVFEARTIGDEHVVIIPVNLRKRFECAPHVEWLIPLCLNGAVEGFSVREG